MDLAGKAVIVTGSSSGIGEAIARRLSGFGAGIVVNSASSAEAGQRSASKQHRFAGHRQPRVLEQDAGEHDRVAVTREQVD